MCTKYKYHIQTCAVTVTTDVTAWFLCCFHVHVYFPPFSPQLSSGWCATGCVPTTAAGARGQTSVSPVDTSDEAAPALSLATSLMGEQSVYSLWCTLDKCFWKSVSKMLELMRRTSLKLPPYVNISLNATSSGHTLHRFPCKQPNMTSGGGWINLKQPGCMRLKSKHPRALWRRRV